MNFTAVNCPFLLSNEEFKQDNSISFFPNPANEVVNIQMDSALKSAVLFNLQGQKIKTVTTKEVNISDLISGVYMIRIEDQQGRESIQKLIKK